MDDKKIVDLFFERNENAVRESSEKYGKYCYFIANNILDCPEDSEECVNDTLLRAWNSIPPAKPTSLKAYLGRITRNLALDTYDRKKAQKRSSQVELAYDEISEFVSGGENPEEKFEETELISEINAFLASLPKEKRKIFVARYWFFESAEEISKRTGKNKIYIRNTLNRTRTKLIKHLKERGFEL